MTTTNYDIIVIGAGSGGLSVGLFMGVAGFRVLMIAKTGKEIGGECLNDGCVPSKALIHVAKLAHYAKMATALGLEVNGKVDIKKAINYVYNKQEIIRKHENEDWLKEQGIDTALGVASFAGKNSVEVNGTIYRGKKIVIATGSKPRKLKVPGIELVKYFDNENIFRIDDLPERLLIIGGGPIGIEMAQAFNRLGTSTTVMDMTDRILVHDEESVVDILLQRLKGEGTDFIFNASIEKFSSACEAIIKHKNGETGTIHFDAVFVGIGRELKLEELQLDKAGIAVKDKK